MPARARTASLAFVLVLIFLDTLGIGLITPILPQLLIEYAHGDAAAASGSYGLLVAVYAAMQFLFAPVIGALSDRFGRRKVILGCLLGVAPDYLLMTFAPSVSWLLVGRVIAGITASGFSAATSYVADITPPHDRARSFGLCGGALGLGLIVGPALGGLLGEVHVRAPFLVAALLNFLTLLYGAFVLPESLRPEDRRAFSFARANPVTPFLMVRSRWLVVLTAAALCDHLAQEILKSVWALHAGLRFSWGSGEIGASFAVVGLVTAVVQAGLVGAIVGRIGERRAVLLGLAASAIAYLGLAAATRGWMAFALILPFAFGSLAGPATLALMTREVSRSEQGELQASQVALASTTAVVGPLLGTWWFAHAAPGAVFLTSAGLVLGGLFGVAVLARR
jgi:DHA1 family tetracycline resistance protein-like MFS transporter